MRIVSFLLIGSLAVCLVVRGYGDGGFSQDEIAIYRAFIGSYTNGTPGPVHLGNRAMSLELAEHERGSDCLTGIGLPVPHATTSRGRLLDPGIVDGTKMVLVDGEKQVKKVKANDPSERIRSGESVEDAVKAAFASGLLEVSEIAFDESRRHAVLKFRFVCGMLCGQGALVVFEKTSGGWKKANHQCGLWVS